MMTLSVHSLPKAVCKSERQTGDFSAAKSHAVVWEAVLVHNHAVDSHLAQILLLDPSGPVAWYPLPRELLKNS